MTLDDSSGLTIEAKWEKPLVAADGGNATLMLRIAPVAKPAQGERRAPLDVAFALDRSGSMSGEKLELVKDAVDVAASFLRDEDRVSLTIYDHAVETLQPLSQATARVKTALRLALRGIDAGGSTALADGWLTACQTLAEAPVVTGSEVRIRRTLLLTDGLANVGITNPTELTTHAHELRRRGISTSTLGVGADFDEELLAGMAEAGGGNFRYIATAGELRAFFEAELGELLTIVAAGLSLDLTLPHGLRASLISPYPGERAGKRLSVSLRDLPAGEEIRLVFSVTAAPGMVGTLHQVHATVCWSDTHADTRRQTEVAVPGILLTDAGTVAATSADPEVAEEAALQHAANERREAIRLDRAGRYAESRARLRDSQAALAAAAYSPAAQAYLAEGAVLVDHAEFMPMSPHLRKHATASAHKLARSRQSE